MAGLWIQPGGHRYHPYYVDEVRFRYARNRVNLNTIGRLQVLTFPPPCQV